MIVSMKSELVKWLDIDLGNCMVVGSSLGELTLNFIFGVFGFGLNMKGLEGNPSGMEAEGWLENSHNELVNDNKHHLISKFRPKSFG